MKTIIIPAHSSEASVNLFKLALSLFKDQPVHIRFLQIREVPDNYNDLLTIGRHAPKCQPFNNEFIGTINQLKQLYGDQVNFSVDHIYGDSPVIFRNYTEYRNADLVMYDKQQWQDSKKKHGLNIFRMVSRCGCELMYVSGDHLLPENELPAPSAREERSMKERQAPVSIQYQYNAISAQLNNSLYEKQVVSKRFSNLSRYFLNEDVLQKMLSQSEGSLLLLKK
jgi:hypothetical protein